MILNNVFLQQKYLQDFSAIHFYSMHVENVIKVGKILILSKNDLFTN